MHFIKRTGALVIEFAWKSSKIEGQYHSLLDTEFLLRNGIAAPGKSKFETQMILNHKHAYLFAVESARRHPISNVASTWNIFILFN